MAAERSDENEAFRLYLMNLDGAKVDEQVHQLNDTIAPQIDCTECGACCKNLMINIIDAEIKPLALVLDMPENHFKEKFIEISHQGQMVMNAIPCTFLKGNKCSVYGKRFNECRDFPHLHKDHFKGRLFGTLIHYAMCPIVYNVVEGLKVETGFFNETKA